MTLQTPSPTLDRMSGKTTDSHPDIGIVIIGRNEGERLRRCFHSIKTASAVIYVDSGSTDRSVDLAREFGVMTLKLNPDEPFTASRARSEGAAAILDTFPKLRFLQFVDGDCVLEAGWLEIAREALLKDERLAAVCGRRKELHPDDTFYNRLFDDEWDTPVGLATATGGDALFRVEAYRAVEGFEPSLSAGEEPELAYRLRAQGWLIERLAAPMTSHDADMHRFSQWWSRAKRSGYGYFQAFRATKNGTSAPLYRGELIRAFSWTFGPPLLSIALALVFGEIWLLTAIALWTLQFIRTAFKLGVRKAGLFLLAKFAESYGALLAMRDAFKKAKSSAITYK